MLHYNGIEQIVSNMKNAAERIHQAATMQLAQLGVLHSGKASAAIAYTEEDAAHIPNMILQEVLGRSI